MLFKFYYCRLGDLRDACWLFSRPGTFSLAFQRTFRKKEDENQNQAPVYTVGHHKPGVRSLEISWDSQAWTIGIHSNEMLVVRPIHSKAGPLLPYPLLLSFSPSFSILSPIPPSLPSLGVEHRPVHVKHRLYLGASPQPQPSDIFPHCFCTVQRVDSPCLHPLPHSH